MALVSLRHVAAGEPGLRRLRQGSGFRYVDARGRPVRSPAVLRRIRSLAIPPAWTDVWICRDERGHLQATGRDARGRKQYRYHPWFRETRDEVKYSRLLAFARALPKLRAQVEHDMALPGLPREKVLATVVRLLEVALIRVGNREYTRKNGSFGLTTLQDEHAKIERGAVEFRFRGKSGVLREVRVDDPRLARIVKRCRDLPGEQLFQYLDEEGAQHAVTSADVNDYLRRVTGKRYSAKDFRTWAGTVLAAWALAELAEFDTKVRAKRNVVEAVRNVAKRLGNTPSVCRKCYVHPAVFDAYLDGKLVTTLQARAEAVLATELPSLSPEEGAVVALLRQRLRMEARTRREGMAGTLARSVQKVRRERVRSERARAS